MKRTNYTYRFMYKIATYILSGLLVMIITLWIHASIQRDSSIEMQMFWRDLYIRKTALLLRCSMENDIMIDLLTVDEFGVCEVYCERLRAFKCRRIKRELEGNLHD